MVGVGDAADAGGDCVQHGERGGDEGILVGELSSDP